MVTPKEELILVTSTACRCAMEDAFFTAGDRLMWIPDVGNLLGSLHKDDVGLIHDLCRATLCRDVPSGGTSVIAQLVILTIVWQLLVNLSVAGTLAS